MTKKILSYFHLFSSYSQANQKAAGAKLPAIFWDIAHFFCLLFGIVSYHFVKAYQSIPHEHFKFELDFLVYSAIIAFAIFPAVFKKVADTANPKFIQLCMTFASGLGYQSLFAAGSAVFLNKTVITVVH